MREGPSAVTSPPGASRWRRWRDRDHTRAGLAGSLVVLALPMGVSSLAVVAFQLADLGFLSRLGEAPMAAVVIANQSLRQLFFLLLMGAGFGTQALIAREVGAHRIEAAGRVAGQVVLLGAVYAGGLAVLGLGFAETLYSLPGPDPSFVPYGVAYLRLLFALAFGFVGVQLFGAILGGAGDTTTPLLMTLLQTSLAVLAEWCLIFGHFGLPALGVRGAALGLVAGQIAALALGMVLLFGGRARVHLRLRHLVPDPAVLGSLLRLAWPPAVQMAGGVVLVFAFLRLTGRFGDGVQAAYAIGLRLGMVVPLVCFPLASACATLVGQSLGAGDVPRAWRTVRLGLVVHGGVMWSFAVLTFLLRDRIAGLFTDDPEVLRVASEYLVFAAGSFALWAFYFVFLRALQGAGDVFVPMLISLGNVVLVAVPLAHLLSRTSLGPTGIWTAQLVSSAVMTLATGAWLATGRWTRRAPGARRGPR